jgi:hypothetical protein
MLAAMALGADGVQVVVVCRVDGIINMIILRKRY